MFKSVHPGYYELSDPNMYCADIMTPAQYTEQVIDNAIFSSDDFRMYAYKVRRCPRMRSHDWTECPYAHRGEKAQRRDPRKFTYLAIVCPAYRAGRCLKGDLCEYSHGVFEYWLHPSKYRTRACNAGPFCQRKVCFFAHTPEQLRSEPKVSPRKYYVPQHQYEQPHYPQYRQNDYVYRPVAQVGGVMINGGVGGTSARPPTAEEYETMLNNKRIMDESFEKVEKFLDSLRSLKLGDGSMENGGWEHGENSGEVEASVSDLPDLPDLAELNWITDIVQ